MGYTRPGCRVTGGRVLFDGQDMLTLGETRLRGIRGARNAYVAQSPAASFNPAKRLGRQVAETLVLHRGQSWPDAEARAAELFAELDLPSPDTFGRRFPAPGFRRPVAARHDRHGHRVRSGTAHPRRADDGARCDDADRGPRRDPQDAPPPSRRGALHHPRSRRRRAGGAPAACAAARRRGRNRGDARRHRRSAQRLYAATFRCPGGSRCARAPRLPAQSLPTSWPSPVSLRATVATTPCSRTSPSP